MAVTSPYDSITPESIKAEMLSELNEKGVLIDTREGSYTNTLVSTAAYQIFKLYQQFPKLLSVVFPDENAGEYIDKHAAQIGMFRRTGKKAAVIMSFTGTEGTYIPAGTNLYAPETGLRYLTTEDVRIVKGTAQARAEAAEVGTEYNLPADSITSMYTNVAGVKSVNNPTAAIGGADVESDADFYSRYHNRRTLPITSGNKNHYVTWATETDGVSYASCVPLWNGNGTVKVVIAGPNRKAVDESTRSACAFHIEEERPIGAVVTVVSAQERRIPLTASVTLMDGYTSEQVRVQLETLVGELLSSQKFGEEIVIPFSRFLACLLRCPGVADYSAFTVDGQISSVVIRAEDAPVVGTISVTQTGGGT